MSSTPQKKFLDINGITYFARLLNNYPNNELLGTVINAIGEELEQKTDLTQVEALMMANDNTIIQVQPTYTGGNYFDYFINVPSGATLTFNIISASNNITLRIFGMANETGIDSSSYDSLGQIQTIIGQQTNNSAKRDYKRIRFYNGTNEFGTYNIKITVSTGSSKEIALNNLGKNTCSIFRNVAVIGDSYSAGHIQLEGASNADSYNPNFAFPHYMSLLTGQQWDCYAISGSTAGSWLENSTRGLPALQNAGKYQAYVIGLGLNEINFNVPTGTIEDIGTDNNTYYRNLAKVITEINTINPTAKIFINTIPTEKTRADEINTAIKAIVNYYSSTYPIHLIDLTEYKDFYNSLFLNQDSINGHKTALGYELFAEIYFYILSKYICKNIDDFQDVYKIPCQPSKDFPIKNGTGLKSLIISHIDNNIASGDYTFASGYKTTASGINSHAEGFQSQSTGSHSHAEGYMTIASGNSSHTEGQETQASGDQTHAEGYKTQATKSSGHSEGNQTLADGYQAHSEGYKTQAIGNSSHAEGQETLANTDSTHTEGYKTQALGFYAHAEGANNIARGQCSHIEGNEGEASGTASHVEGQYNIAKGFQSHVEGEHNISNYANQHVFGMYNLAETTDSSITNNSNKGTFVEIVGNGNYNSTTQQTVRSNARTLDWQGNETLAGNLILGNTGKLIINNNELTSSNITYLNNLPTIITAIQSQISDLTDNTILCTGIDILDSSIQNFPATSSSITLPSVLVTPSNTTQQLLYSSNNLKNINVSSSGVVTKMNYDYGVSTIHIACGLSNSLDILVNNDLMLSNTSSNFYSCNWIAWIDNDTRIYVPFSINNNDGNNKKLVFMDRNILIKANDVIQMTIPGGINLESIFYFNDTNCVITENVGSTATTINYNNLTKVADNSDGATNSWSSNNRTITLATPSANCHIAFRFAYADSIREDTTLSLTDTEIQYAKDNIKIWVHHPI